MNDDEIRALVKIMDEGNLTALRVTDGDKKVELERNGLTSTAALPLVEGARKLFARDAVREGDAQEAVADTGAYVKSPMVGTFYVAPSPDEPPFVKVGQEIIVGQTVGIVEAMKMMNEITSETAGTIVEILANNGQQVEYDQPLFRIETK